MDYLKELLTKIPEWWISLNLPFTFTIGIPILVVLPLIMFAFKKIKAFLGIIFILAIILGFFALMGIFLK
ncbi:MAG: hypothetical protein COV72_00360 [Candidatus Omnitrophica bacterium CG11_big_fil_rev_8_21_14_0_20_42_13]|uniref:Uncharacterized protein n=1 Tax=Candidatus Ghiorseimicrobium undicola TaxID=1974746 RepID=A0A2H0LZZ8_9BACT|nr:MAG: hypothetical protein COV72_00360 [Candidatus Omnitrophica bacterium CG11_big_fil_rev_8_21_14_0_20_42_13]